METLQNSSIEDGENGSPAPAGLEGTLPPLPADGITTTAADPTAAAVSTGRGWLIPRLLDNDARLYGRWDYHWDAWTRGALPDASETPLPRIAFLSAPDAAVMKMITTALDAIPNNGRGGWQGWSSPNYFSYFLEWMLFGLGHSGQMSPPAEPPGCEGADKRLRSLIDLARWQAAPYDYLGDLIAQNAYGRRNAFYPTPHAICELMVQVTMGSGDAADASGIADEPDIAPADGPPSSDSKKYRTSDTRPDGTRDSRILTVCDPCVGTGRLLLHASNYSLRLYGMDIDPMMCRATLVNGYLFAPWMVRPLPFLDRVQYDSAASAPLSDLMARQAPPHQEEKLRNSEHDASEQWRFEPIKKRRDTTNASAKGTSAMADAENSGDILQGTLFE